MGAQQLKEEMGMKKLLIIGLAMVAGSLLAGPQINLRNEMKVAERKADDSWKASTNYMSEVQYMAELESATKFDDLKAVLLKKAMSDKVKANKEKEEKQKVKEK